MSALGSRIEWCKQRNISDGVCRRLLPRRGAICFLESQPSLHAKIPLRVNSRYIRCILVSSCVFFSGSPVFLLRAFRVVLVCFFLW